MDDQRLEEIARRQLQQSTYWGRMSSSRFHEEAVKLAGVTCREALSAQEEELAAFRRNDAVIRSEYGWKRDGRELPELIEEELRSLREERDSLRLSLLEVNATHLEQRQRANAAEAELLRLRDRIGSDQGWSCVECGTFTPGTSIELESAVCRCGVGKGRWGACMRPVPDPVEAFYVKVNARAEADMLKGNPIQGAHHRALEAEIEAYRVAGQVPRKGE